MDNRLILVTEKKIALEEGKGQEVFQETKRDKPSVPLKRNGDSENRGNETLTQSG